MKLLVFADLHLDTTFGWAGPELARRRRRALRDTLFAIVELVGELNPDAVLCGGDLYEHDRFSPDTAEDVRQAFERMHPTPVFIAPGNHDWLGPQSLYRQVRFSPNVHVFSSDRLEAAELAHGIMLWGAAHLRPAGTRGFLGGFRVDHGGVHLALFHGSERGGLPFETEGKQPHAPFEADDIEAVGLHHAFVGHFHRPRDADRYTYPGNPEPLTFGEGGDLVRGVIFAQISSDGQVHRQRHQIAQTQVHDRTVDVTGCASGHEVEERVRSEIEALEGYVRVRLTGELEPPVDFHPRDLAARHGDKVVCDASGVRVAYEIDAIAREATVRGRFVSDVLESDLDPELGRRVLVTGLRALEGRQDLEVP